MEHQSEEVNPDKLAPLLILLGIMKAIFKLSAPFPFLIQLGSRDGCAQDYDDSPTTLFAQ